MVMLKTNTAMDIEAIMTMTTVETTMKKMMETWMNMEQRGLMQTILIVNEMSNIHSQIKTYT